MFRSAVIGFAVNSRVHLQHRVPMRVAILGASGYLGCSYSRAKPPAKVVMIPVERAKIDYTNPVVFKKLLNHEKIDKIIIFSGFRGKPNVDVCEDFRDLCHRLNVELPEMLASVCSDENKPFLQIGFGCIYRGVPNLEYPDQGFKETDEPNFCFEHPPCSYYSGTKAEMEQKIKDIPGTTIWRLRMPFSGVLDSRNLLVKLASYQEILEAKNSLTCLEEFVEKTLDMLAAETPSGIYNCTNSDAILNSEIVNLLVNKKIRLTKPTYFHSEEEISSAMKSPRSSCVLDCSKVSDLGFGFLEVHVALETCLKRLRLAYQ